MRLSDSVNMDRIGTLLLFHYPTTWNHVLSDHAVTFRVLPISATENGGHDQVAGPQGRRRGHRLPSRRTDQRLDGNQRPGTTDVEENARGFASRPISPAPIRKSHEGGVAQFVEWYSDFMVERLTAVRACALLRDLEGPFSMNMQPLMGADARLRFISTS